MVKRSARVHVPLALVCKPLWSTSNSLTSAPLSRRMRMTSKRVGCVPHIPAAAWRARELLVLAPCTMTSLTTAGVERGVAHTTAKRSVSVFGVLLGSAPCSSNQRTRGSLCRAIVVRKDYCRTPVEAHHTYYSGLFPSIYFRSCRPVASQSVYEMFLNTNFYI